MKNPFRRFRGEKPSAVSPATEQPAVSEPPAEPIRAESIRAAAPAPDPPVPETPTDSFVEWCRSNVRGGVERRERNDIFEAYNVYGVDGDRLVCRCYHRYPEHQRDFELSLNRSLRFDEFNRRLLSELDRGDLTLEKYSDSIANAQRLTADTVEVGYAPLSETELKALDRFLESLDTLTVKERLFSCGVLRLECESVIGAEELNLWFRKILPFDAAFGEVAGVTRTPIKGYEIESLWVMSLYNRLCERCSACEVHLLTSSWSVTQASVYLLTARGFPDIDAPLLIAVGDRAGFLHFGFYALDFSKK